MTVREKLAALREKMTAYKMDMYLIGSEDFHGSEYVGEHFKCRAFISGFTGSAGTILVTQDFAGLWTDGRYFLQAQQQLDGSANHREAPHRKDEDRNGAYDCPGDHQALAPGDVLLVSVLVPHRQLPSLKGTSL